MMTINDSLEKAWDGYLGFSGGEWLADRRRKAADRKTAEEMASVDRAAEGRMVKASAADDGRTDEQRMTDQESAKRKEQEEKDAATKAADERTAKAEKSAMTEFGDWVGRQDVVNTVVDWFVPRRFFFTFVVVVALIVVIVVGWFTGYLETSYHWFIGWASDGVPFTHIMRDHPERFWITAAVVLAILFRWVPRTASGRLSTFLGLFLVGFLGGHVFWGGG